MTTAIVSIIILSFVFAAVMFVKIIRDELKYSKGEIK